MGYNRNFYDTDFMIDIVGKPERDNIARQIKQFDKSFKDFERIDSRSAELIEKAGAMKLFAADVARDGTMIRTWYHNGKYYLCKD